MLETFLLPYSEYKIIPGIFKEGIFTNLNLLRLIVQASCNSEQYWVPGEYGEIDCMIIKSFSNKNDPPIIIFCNPNGGLYEYACYQNQ